VFGLLWFFKKYLGWKYEEEESGEQPTKIPELADTGQTCLSDRNDR
jgi:hypothetical protein